MSGRTVRARIGLAAVAAAGLDDPLHFAEVSRTWTASACVLDGPADWLARIADDFEDRADPRDGYDHTPAERAACRRAARTIRAAVARARTGEVTD